MRPSRHWVLLVGSSAVIGSGVALGQVGIIHLVDANLPDARGIAAFNRPGTITLLSSDGQVIQKRGPASRDKVDPGEMPELVKQAFVAAEDRRFYDHDGVDLWGISRAVFTNIKQGSVQEGASTITQQLARTVFLSQDRTIIRKLREAALAYKLERQLSKEQILEQYLNYVYLGAGAYGVADAAWVYFSKTPDQLTLPEAALIAGLPPAPSVYSPLLNEKVALERRAIVLQRMQSEGFITSSEAKAANTTPLNLKPATPKYFNSQAPYFTAWVDEQLQNYLTPEQIEVGGLEIRTSLNLDWQKKAQQVVRDASPGSREGSIVSIEPGTGLVRVMVGGKNFEASQFNRAAQALRSPGSTFKLFPYTAAVNAGVRPSDIFMDSPRCWDGYCPQNAGGKYSGPVSLANALQSSLNTVAVQLQDKVGFDAVIEVANKLGVGNQRPLRKVYSMALGSFEQTVVDMTGAFAGIANRGIFHKPIPFEEIRGPSGSVLWSRRTDGAPGLRAVDSEVADTMNWMLQRVVAGGTGSGAYLGDRPVAGKTGTSEGAKDLWFIGSIPQLTTGVWLGYDNSMGTGSSSAEAAWTWSKFMRLIKGNFPVQQFPPKPVLTRPFKDPRRNGSTSAPYRGYEHNSDSYRNPDQDNNWDTSTPAKPEPAEPVQPVIPDDGPPVDEFFRPLPVN